jgi:Fe-S-cluster containining protein
MSDMQLIQIRDSRLLQSIDTALADATTRSGPWLACRPGCAQCCHGVFPISQLDAERLRNALQSASPELAARIRTRVADSVHRLTPDFPGNIITGIIDPENPAFDDFANEEPCPVLDPTTQTCDLYAARPIPCRTFGPPVRNSEGGLAVCELCFIGAPPETVAACEMLPDPQNLEPKLIAEAEARAHLHGETIITFALRNA